MENATKARELAERARAAQQKDLKGREAGVATAKARSADTEARIASAENDLIKSQTEKAPSIQTSSERKRNRGIEKTGGAGGPELHVNRRPFHGGVASATG